jgi:hypothetical protein
MPHCQKENHDRGSKSKEERWRKKEQAMMRKKTSQTAAANAELEANKKLQPNNVAFADGFGDYEVGCDAETEFTVPRFNLKKRSKKVRPVVSCRESCLLHVSVHTICFMNAIRIID